MAKDLTEGSRAPAFRLPMDGGKQVSLSGFKGQKLVVFFYPKAGTSGCTREAMDFSALRARFAKARTSIVGISPDPIPTLERFKAKSGLAITLASDTTHKTLLAYGAWGEKLLYGRKYIGVLRKTVLIDQNGRIARIWPKVRIDGHAADVLAAAQAHPAPSR